MRISIALCTWNGAPFLAEQLASLSVQTRLPDELVVSDDASSDATIEIVERFASTAPFTVRLNRNSDRLGVVRNFARAIVECSGDLIFLCDQDDIWRPDKIAVLLREFDARDVVSALFTNAGLDGGTTLWDHIGFKPRERRLVDGGDAFELLVRRNVVTGATLAFRERWRQAILPIPEVAGLLHDEWIALVIAAMGTVGAVDENLIYYRQHAAQAAGAGSDARGVRRWVDSARETGPESHLERANKLSTLLHRLERIAAPTERIDDLRQRIAHLHARASLPSTKLRRVPKVMREAATLRYFRYSNHLWSIAKDLFW